MGTVYYGDNLDTFLRVLKLLLDAVFGQNIASQVQFRHTCSRNG
jgi:hypothetical protein